MKKLILSFLSCLILFSAYATDYTGDLVITLDESTSSTDKDRTVTVEYDAAKDSYKLSITNFSFQKLSIGDIVVEGVKGEESADKRSVRLYTENSYELTVMLVMKVSVDFEGVISKDENLIEKSFKITKLNIKNVPKYGTITCTFEGTAPASTAIQSIVADTNDYQIYNLTGRKVDNMNESGIYIIRYSNGVTKKIIKK